jgi:hypothetical protein
VNTRSVTLSTMQHGASFPTPSTSLLATRLGPPILALLLGAFAPPVCAQSANDGFDPNVAGYVEAIVTQPDGKILVGGSFQSVGGVPRTNIVRLNVDGTVDLSFGANHARRFYQLRAP